MLPLGGVWRITKLRSLADFQIYPIGADDGLDGLGPIAVGCSGSSEGAADAVEVAASADWDPDSCDEYHPACQRFLRHLHLLACRDRGLRADRIWSGAQQLFRWLHTGRATLRTDHRTGWAHPRLCSPRRNGRRCDRGHAAAGGPLAWSILRAVIGFGCSGLFIATESWLNAKAEPTERGKIFSAYMFGTFLALALGQLLIGHVKVETAEPFNAIAVLFAVALVIVSTTRAEPPRLTTSTSRVRPIVPRGAHCVRRLHGERAAQCQFLLACSCVDAG